jgi:tRNA 2-thiouridine synthesizing protein A
MSENRIEVELDAIGQKCPMPLLSTKKALSNIAKGQILKIMATDKNAVKDLKAFCGYTDHEFIDDRSENEIFIIRILKG